MKQFDVCKIKAMSTERYQLDKVKDYLVGASDQVCVLYGLRRTGKSTIIAQAVRWLLDVQKAAPKDILYLEAENSGYDSMDDVYDKIEKSGAEYIFVDEISFVNDFIQRSAALYDMYSKAYGKRVVIARTNLTSIFVARLSTLYDRTLRIKVHYLTYYEHCKFVTKVPASWESFLQYLRTGGLFNRVESLPEYLQTAIIEHLEDTLSSATYNNLGQWLDSCKFAGASWTGILDSICLCSAGNVDNRILQKLNSFWEDRTHLQQMGADVSKEVLDAVQNYFCLGDSVKWTMKQNEVAALLRFLEDCGMIVALPNIAEQQPPSNRNKYYLSFPFMRYAFTVQLLQECGLTDTVKASGLLGLLLEGCAVSEYKLAYPEERVYFWREMVDVGGVKKMAECDIVVTDAKEMLSDVGRREAFEIKLEHNPQYSGIYSILREHPEFGLDEDKCIKLEGQEVMHWIYKLGAAAYDTGATACF